MEGRGGPRIAFVGGGSYQWGPKIIQDVALNEGLRVGSLILHDIDGEALDDMYEWGTRVLDMAQADLKLEKTLQLEESLRGADFVVLSISTGGLDATALDLEIPPLRSAQDDFALPRRDQSASFCRHRTPLNAGPT